MLRSYIPSEKTFNRIAIAVAVIWHGALAAYCIESHREFLREKHREIREKAQMIEHYLAETIQLCTNTLKTIEPDVRRAEGDVKRIRAILFQHLDARDGILRFSWADSSHKVRTGSHIGIMDVPVDISDRHYIRLAKQQPGRFFISPVVMNRFSGMPQIVICRGVNSHRGSFQGSLSCIIGITPLQDLLIRSVAYRDMDLTILSPYGEVIYRNGTSTNFTALSYNRAAAIPSPQLRNAATPFPASPADGFIVKARTSDEYIDSLHRRSLSKWALCALFGTLLYVALWHWARQHFVQPVQQLMHALNEIPLLKISNIHGAYFGEIIHKIDTIREHLEEAARAREEQARYMSEMEYAVAMIHDLHREQTGFLRSAGIELEDAFNAISRYAYVLEEEISNHAIDPSHAYSFDEVVEIGENLKLMANAYYLTCAIRNGTHHLALRRVNLHTVTIQIIDMLAPNIEHRDLELILHNDDTTAHQCIADELLLRHILWSLFFLAIKYASPSSRIIVRIRKIAGRVLWRVSVEQCATDAIPKAADSLHPFMPIKPGELQQAAVHALSHHANMHLATLLAREMEGMCRAAPFGAHGYSLECSLPERVG